MKIVVFYYPRNYPVGPENTPISPEEGGLLVYFEAPAAGKSIRPLSYTTHPLKTLSTLIK